VAGGLIVSPDFTTTNLDLAAYLSAVGQPLLSTEPQGRFLAFHFSTEAASHAEAFLAGARASAQAVLEHYRELRTLIANHERKAKKLCSQPNVVSL